MNYDLHSIFNEEVLKNKKGQMSALFIFGFFLKTLRKPFWDRLALLWQDFHAQSYRS
jgi:hypothetical protein